MGQGYVLINKSSKEVITYAFLRASKARELSGNSVTSAITSWYLLKNMGDKIQFIEEEKVGDGYTDVTNQIIEELIENKILKDNGFEVFDEEPIVYMRKLENVWAK